MIGEGAQGDVAASTPVGPIDGPGSHCVLSDCSASCGSGTRSRSRAVIEDGDECRVPLDAM